MHTEHNSQSPRMELPPCTGGSNLLTEERSFSHAGTDPVSPMGFAALAGLVGLAGGMVLAPWLERLYHRVVKHEDRGGKQWLRRISTAAIF